MKRSSLWTALGAIAALVVVIGVCVHLWVELGDAGMSTAGWIALALGVIATLAVGIGLMSLVFISARRGYDETDPHRHR